GNVQDIYPLAPLQEGILFHHLLENEGDAYVLRSVAAFDSRERVEEFLTALQTVVDRHDILRTSIHWRGLAQAVQVVCRRAPIVIQEFAAQAGDSKQVLLRRTEPRHVRMDLERAPLIASYLTHDAESGEWLLAVLTHHMIADHITIELIFAE